MKETIILLYGGRSAEREVSVLSAESVMRAVNYDRFTVKTFFISQSGDFIKTQEFSQKPGQDDRLRRRSSRLSSSSWPDGRGRLCPRFPRSLENALCGMQYLVI